MARNPVELLVSPFVLCAYSFKIYVWQCLVLYFRQAFFMICCIPCRVLNIFWEFTDSEFPPQASSLGAVSGDTAGGKVFKGHNVEWIRADELCDEGMQLFAEGVNSQDIMQGQLGDCWLLAAMACLAEYPGAIYKLFKTKHRDPRGKYKIRLYDGQKERWKTMVVDDYIPCVAATRRPLFTRPNGKEMWVLLLEKAFAKFCGSYSNIEAGHTIWALKAMTGDKARLFQRSGTVWKRVDFHNVQSPTDKRASAFTDPGERHDNNSFFEILRKYDARQSCISIGGASGQGGLIRGHAYSVLKVRVAAGYRLVQIRNPHSHGGEWQGDWSDHSPLWNRLPEVKNAVKHDSSLSAKEHDDGIFWMAWEDFVQHWDHVDIVDRSLDIDSLRLEVESDSPVAPAEACLGGCFQFWCLCEGPKLFYCPTRTSDKTIEADGGSIFPCFRRRRKYKQVKWVAGPQGARGLPVDSDEDSERDSGSE